MDNSDTVGAVTVLHHPCVVLFGDRKRSRRRRVPQTERGER